MKHALCHDPKESLGGAPISLQGARNLLPQFKQKTYGWPTLHLRTREAPVNGQRSNLSN